MEQTLTALATAIGTLATVLGALWRAGLLDKKEKREEDAKAFLATFWKNSAIEYMEAARQSGKQENSQLVYDMQKLLDKLDSEIVSMNRRLSSIEEHLKQMNGKVFENMRNINGNAVAIARLEGKKK